MKYTLKTKDGIKILASDNLNDIYIWVFDNDQYIKGYVKEKNKEIVYILTNKSLCDAMEYILERFSLYSK